MSKNHNKFLSRTLHPSLLLLSRRIYIRLMEVAGYQNILISFTNFKFLLKKFQTLQNSPFRERVGSNKFPERLRPR